MQNVLLIIATKYSLPNLFSNMCVPHHSRIKFKKPLLLYFTSDEHKCLFVNFLEFILWDFYNDYYEIIYLEVKI